MTLQLTTHESSLVIKLDSYFIQLHNTGIIFLNSIENAEYTTYVIYTKLILFSI